MSNISPKELQELVTAGIIPPETAARISDYYQHKKQSAPNTFIIILGILGALLTGSGILLIVAHNWDDLSVSVKTFLSFLPLLIAQIACAYTLLKRKSDRVWIECSSMLLFFAIGACISLISQIYQVNGSLPGFLLVWVLLSLPLIYFLSANTITLFCIAAITWYASDLGYERYGSIPFMYALVLALIVPHYYKLFKRNAESNFFNLLNWFGAVSITIALGTFVSKGTDWFEWVFLLYSILFCIYYLLGCLPFFESKRLFANPFLVSGTLGIIITLLTWSFSFIWKEYKTPQPVEIFSNPLFYLIAAGLIIASTLIWKSTRFHSQKQIDPMGYSFAVLLLLLLLFKIAPSVAVFIVNAWIIFVAVFFIRKGSAKNHLGIVNFGLIIIAALAICRFFDDRIPFVWRGFFFLVTGAAFLQLIIYYYANGNIYQNQHSMLKVILWPGFLLLLLAQWLVPMQMIRKKDTVLNKGISYRFETAPVDPSDPFMGKYIVLNFKENSLKLADTKKFSYNNKVYVSFSAGKNGFATIKTIDITKPQSNGYLETTIRYISDEKDGGTVFLNYPFSRYYMEEYKAPTAEKIYRERNIDSTLKVYALVNIYKGDAVVKDVYVNDSLINDVIRARNVIR